MSALVSCLRLTSAVAGLSFVVMRQSLTSLLFEDGAAKVSTPDPPNAHEGDEGNVVYRTALVMLFNTWSRH